MSKLKAVPASFGDLHLNINDTFKVESLSNKKRYPVRLIGMVENASLIVSAPKINGQEFYLPEGQKLRVRLIAGNYACGFMTDVLLSRRLPYLYSHLSYPKKFEAVAIRQSSRVQLNIPVSIFEEHKGTLYGEWPQQGLIADVSSSGARLHCDQPLAATGSELRVNFNTSVDGVIKKMSVSAMVRNITEVPDAEGGGFDYGVQFRNISDDDRVYISGFVYEQMLFQSDAKLEIKND